MHEKIYRFMIYTRDCCRLAILTNMAILCLCNSSKIDIIQIPSLSHVDASIHKRYPEYCSTYCIKMKPPSWWSWSWLDILLLYKKFELLA